MAHIKMLGGERLLQGISAFVVKKVDSVGFYLQITEDINLLQVSDLVELKALLRPLIPMSETSLPPGYASRWPYLLIHDEEDTESEESRPVNAKQGMEIHIPESAIFEARNWLKNTNHPAALAANRFRTTQAARSFVENLYKIGAKKVYVKLVPLANVQEPYADTVIIKLPFDLEQRKEIFAIFAREISQEFSVKFDEVVEDNGEDELFLWWD